MLRRLRGSCNNRATMSGPATWSRMALSSTGVSTHLVWACALQGNLVFIPGGVDIGRATIIDPNVVILSSSYRIDEQAAITVSGRIFCTVSTREDVWVGANAVILSGRIIGDRAVIGAGSIITHDAEPGSVVRGNPARSLRELGSEQ
jgi:acetyltransferase-like isoleucine patch superfamily enzyme